MIFLRHFIENIIIKSRYICYVIRNLSWCRLFDIKYYSFLKWAFIVRDILPKNASPTTVSLIAKLPFSALSIRELSIYRICNLVESALLLYKRCDMVPALIIARCTLETTAVIFCLLEELISANNSGNIDNIMNYMNKALLGGTGMEDKNIYPFGIGKLISKVNSKVSHFSDFYEKLSRFAHPAYESMLDSYGRLDNEKKLLKLGCYRNEVHDDIFIKSMLPTIKFFIKTYDELPPEITKFAKLCENKIEERIKR